MKKLCNSNLVAKGPKKSVLKSGRSFFVNSHKMNLRLFSIHKNKNFFMFNQILNAIKFGIMKFLFYLFPGQKS